jgi:hypothetical protein
VKLDKTKHPSIGRDSHPRPFHLDECLSIMEVSDGYYEVSTGYTLGIISVSPEFFSENCTL